MLNVSLLQVKHNFNKSITIFSPFQLYYLLYRNFSRLISTKLFFSCDSLKITTKLVVSNFSFGMDVLNIFRVCVCVAFIKKIYFCNFVNFGAKLFIFHIYRKIIICWNIFLHFHSMLVILLHNVTSTICVSVVICMSVFIYKYFFYIFSHFL